jgi:hypothetical protein
MRRICIPPAVQIAGLLGVAGGVAAILAAEGPSIQRYLRIKTM